MPTIGCRFALAWNGGDGVFFNTLTVLYLFLGGTGAGAVVATAGVCAGFPNLIQGRTWVVRALALALAFLGLGASALLFDLPDPRRFVLLFLRPTPSVISVGSFLLTATMVCTCLLLGFEMEKERLVALREERAFTVARRVLFLLSALLGIGAATYTGVLLQLSVPNDCWHTLLVPLLFLASSLSAGAALLMLAALSSGERASRGPLLVRLGHFDLLLAAAKLVLVGLYLGQLPLLAGEPLTALLADEKVLGPLACFLVGGLVVPGFMEALVFLGRLRPSPQLFAFLAVMILLGGYLLRVWIIGLGG